MVFDLETTGLSPAADDIIEIGAVRLVDGVITESFSSFVRCEATLCDEIVTLTGITDRDLQDAPDLEDVLPRFLGFIQGAVLCGHNVDFDLSFLLAACDKLGYDLPTEVDALDTCALARVLLPTLAEHRLNDLAQHYSLRADTFHRAAADAATTAQLLSALRASALALPYVTLQQLERMSSLFSARTGEWIGAISDERYRVHGAALPEGVTSIQQLAFFADIGGAVPAEKGIPDSEQASDERLESSRDGYADKVSQVRRQAVHLLDADSPLQAVMTGFEVRPGQRQMVDAVSAAFEGDSHLVVEAGTGTGKSLAYLIPAALYAKSTDSRVVVSTHTIALQDQIQSRDFPVLRRVVDEDLSLAVLKGRTHYVCMRKLHQEVRVAGIGTTKDDLLGYMTLLVWLTMTQVGNREELPLQGKLPEIWPRIQSETESCINKRCPFFKPCYYFRARAKAFDAHVVVTNHSLVFSDLKADHRVLPKYDKLVLDEAHHLEDEATKHLGSEVYLLQCLSLFGRLSRDGGKHGVVPELLTRLSGSDAKGVSAVPALETMSRILPSLRDLVERAFQTLTHLVPAGAAEQRFTPAVEGTPDWQQFLHQCDDMLDLTSELAKAQADLAESAERETDTELQGRLFDAHGFLYELLGHVQTLCSTSDLSDEWVTWIERSVVSRQHLAIHRAPIDVATILSSTLFDNKASVVLTSATLSVEGSFNHLKDRLGLTGADADGRLMTLSVPSPFDFPKQAMLCVPTDVPDLPKMSAEEAAVWLTDSLYQLAKASGGRLLALFTSHAMLRATAQALREPLQSAGLRLFAQGIDGSRSRILEAFRTEPKSVLLGAQSFWEGIDLPGDQLTTLVIVRLPFSPPTHPVTEARNQRLEAEGKSAFWTASLPDAVVRFRQGFGRLIRTVSDRGVVVVYDKRIVTTKYGNAFVKSLPGVRPVVLPEQQVVQKVRAFLQAQ